MNPQQLLDASIIDPPPPFPGIDELITRERRRHRTRRVVAAMSGTAGVVTVVLGVTLVTAHLGGVRTPDGPGAASTTAVGTPIPPDETPQARYARLSDLLRARIAAVLPTATVASASSEVFGDGDTMFAGYDDAMAAVTITTPDGETDLQIFVVRPLVPPRPQPTKGVAGRLFGGCAGEWSTSTPAVSAADRCEDRIGPGGTRVSVAERPLRPASVLMVTVAFPDGGVVTATAGSAAGLLSPDDLAEIAADPGFVAGRAAPPHEPAIVDPTDPQALRELPAQPEVGVVYPFDLYVHCGVELVRFGGRTWRAEPPDVGALPATYLAGTIELLDHATARFVVDQRHFQTDREVIMFSWAPDDEAPRCA